LYLEKAKFFAFRRWVDHFSKNFFGKMMFWNNKSARSQHEPWLAAEAYQVVDESFSFSFEFFGIILNVVFNILVISYVVDSILFLGYFFSFILMILMVKWLSRSVCDHVKHSQNQKNKLTTLLLKGWDNIVIGNTIHFNNWTSRYQSIFEIFYTSKLKVTKSSQFSSSISSCIGLMPVAIFIAYSYFSNIDDKILLSGLVVTLPRQLQIIQNFYNLTSSTMRLKVIKQRLLELEAGTVPKFNTEVLLKELESKIKLDKISFLNQSKTNLTFQSIRGLLQSIETMKSGKLTIRGQNGAGKSLVCALIKQHFAERALYVPPSSLLMNSHEEDEDKSTGQKIKALFDDLENFPKENLKLYIFDEWDANLDTINTQSVSRIIQGLSENLLVVEVLH
jgi:ABC-type transport system involved in cytochrome bd biosynthesis fused ATPase/permease subunit